MDVNDNELHDRLRSMGTRPVGAEARERHLRRIESVSPGSTESGQRRFGPVAIAAACVVGFFAGSTGLAMAGALPDQAQSVAHDVLGVVQVDVPAGKDGKRGPCVSEAAKIKDKDAKQAAKDACPKGAPDDDSPEDDDSGSDAPGRSGDAPGQNKDAPGRSGDAPGQNKDKPGRSGDAPGQNKDKPNGQGNGTTKHDDDPCKGRPAWAGPMSKADRDAAKAANSRADCPDDSDDAVDDG